MGVLDLYRKYQRVTGQGLDEEPIAFHEKLKDPQRVAVFLSSDSRIPPLVIPALRLLREQHPKIRILLVTGAGNAAALRRADVADKILIIQERKGTKQIGEIRRLAKEIGRHDANLLLVFDPRSDSVLEALGCACHIPLRVGFGEGEKYPFLNFQVAPPAEGSYLADALLKMIGSLTGEFVDFLDDRVRLRVAEPDARKAERLLHFWQPRSDKLLFAIQPACDSGQKSPDFDKFAVVAKLLTRAYDCRTMILTPPEEKMWGEELERRLASIEPYLAPTEDAAHAVAFASRADLLITANTPLFHYAVSIGVPTIGLFAEETEPWWTPPDGVRATILPLHREITEERFLAAVDEVGGEAGGESSA